MGVWTIWASEASARARPAAFRGWNPTPGANHPLKANAGGKLSILSQVVDDGSILVGVIDYVIVEGVVLIDLEVVRLITCR